MRRRGRPMRRQGPAASSRLGPRMRILERARTVRPLTTPWTSGGSVRDVESDGERDLDDVVSFTCNICGAACVPAANLFDRSEREHPTCPTCGSTARFRSVIHSLSSALFGESLVIDAFPPRDVTGIGLSDWEGYAKRLEQKFPGYRNTYYHAEPRLDISALPPELAGTADFLLASEVFEHVVPPVERSFENAHRLLKPGGFLVLTVPYRPDGETIERFPELGEFDIVEFRDSRILVNRTSTGRWEVYDDLVFHGGEGATLEMRQFSLPGLLDVLDRSGFAPAPQVAEPYPPFGVIWPETWSRPILARRGLAS